MGLERAIGLALTVVSLGLLLRLGPDPFTLFAGTVVAAAGIATANVLIPSLVKRYFPARAGLMMGLSTCALTASAAVAAGATVPFGKLMGHGWRGALSPWLVLAVVGLLVWLPQLRRATARLGARRADRPALAQPDHVGGHRILRFAVAELLRTGRVASHLLSRPGLQR